MSKQNRSARKDKPTSNTQAQPRSPLVPALLAVLAVAGVAIAVLIATRPNGSAASSSNGAQAGAIATAPTASAPATARPSTAQPTARTGSGQTAKASGGRTAVTATDGVVTLAIADLGDDVAQFYTFQGKSKTIPFFVLKGSDGVVRVAFDACDVCYAAKKGYHQEGDYMVCNNCGNRFASTRINEVSGGCNPAPLQREVQGGKLIIKASDIEAGTRYF